MKSVKKTNKKTNQETNMKNNFTLLKVATVLLSLPIAFFSCSADSQAKTTSDSVVVSETSVEATGTINRLWWENQIGQGAVILNPLPEDIDLVVEFKNGKLSVNPEVNNIFVAKGDKYFPNSKYLGKKVKLTYNSSAMIGQPKTHLITKIEVLGEDQQNYPPKEYVGFITELTSGDSACITLQKTYDETDADVLRLYIDADDHYQVNLDAAKDIFVRKNYMLQLNPKFNGKKIKVTCEMRDVMNRKVSSTMGENRYEIFREYVVTRIEFVEQ
jgi:hypothetical protein